MTIFSKIIKGEIPSYKIAEDEHFYAFLDINPLQNGHTLVVPKLPEPEADYIFDLDDDLLSAMAVFCKRVAKAQKAALPCKRIGMAVLGESDYRIALDCNVSGRFGVDPGAIAVYEHVLELIRALLLPKGGEFNCRALLRGSRVAARNLNIRAVI